MTMKLYEATAALGITEEWLEETGGELTPALEALLEQAGADFADKVERVALKVRELEAEAKALGDEIARLKARQMARENGAKSLKAYLQRCLTVAGTDKVNGLIVTVALQQNPAAVQVPDWTDEQLRELYEAGAPGIELVPSRFAVNKAEMKKAVERGAAPTGVTLTRGTSLRIR